MRYGLQWVELHLELKTRSERVGPQTLGQSICVEQIIELQKKLQILENWRGSESVLEDTYTMKMKLNWWLNVEEEMRHQQSRNS